MTNTPLQCPACFHAPGCAYNPLRTIGSRELLERHATRLLAGNPEAIAGYAVAILGIKRSAFLMTGGDNTYDERMAFIGNHQAACDLMSLLYSQNRDLWRYARVIPVERVECGIGLPTVNGW